MIEGEKKEIRTRLAPSPTGLLHLGTARTGLFNWLFAKNHGGKFVLRIEDTDKERSKKEYEENIISGLKWLGINWDEGPDIGGEYGPYRQSERLDIYEKYLKKLLDEGHAFYCFCSIEELEKNKQAMMSQGLTPKYSGRCKNLSKEEIEKKIKNRDKAVIRFKMSEVNLEFTDLIRGNIKYDTGMIGDIIIAKSLREPLYNFSAAVDDYLMRFSHIIRGEDHISNTPKQIMIQRALGFDTPQYAHLPLILAPDRSKLSKRYLETSLSDYQQTGYLSEAMVNFIALLGWHPKEDKEILNYNELIKEFELFRVQKAGAIFNIEKLDWFNSQYIKKKSIEELMESTRHFIPEIWYSKKDLLAAVIEIEKERAKKLSDFKELAGFFFDISDYDSNLLIWKKSDKIQTVKNLELLHGKIENISEKEFNKETLEENIMALAELHGKGELLWPLRVSLSGLEHSPGPFEIMSILGKEETLKRINAAINKLK